MQTTAKLLKYENFKNTQRKVCMPMFYRHELHIIHPTVFVDMVVWVVL